MAELVGGHEDADRDDEPQGVLQEVHQRRYRLSLGDWAIGVVILSRQVVPGARLATA
jgi:hypothetical protein